MVGLRFGGAVTRAPEVAASRAQRVRAIAESKPCVRDSERAAGRGAWQQSRALKQGEKGSVACECARLAALRARGALARFWAWGTHSPVKPGASARAVTEQTRSRPLRR